MSRTLVVVGHGMVGHRLVDAAVDRGLTDTWRVVVHAEEDVAAYDRVGLSTWFDGADLALPAQLHPAVDLRLGDPVVAVDTVRRTVTARSGRVTAYDALVLATGSTPFVPPVPGSTGPGRFVYRTMQDLAAIRAHAAGARTGAVVGGGLLGLEAANALRALGLETTVVEFAPRLMPLQVDEGGGQALRRLVEQLGVRVRVGATTKIIQENDRGLRMIFAEGDPLDVDLVVFSAGIRPHDTLARTAGLQIAERGGLSSTTRAGRTRSTSSPWGSARTPPVAAGVWLPPAMRWPRSSSIGSSAAARASRVVTCRPSLNVSASTWRASAMRTPPRRAHWSWSTPTRSPGSTRSSWSPTTQPCCSAGFSSATPAATRCCGRWSAAC